MTKLLKVTISGAYINSKRELVDYDGVTGLIPVVDEDLAKMHVRGRYAPMWIKAAVNEKTGEPKYPERIDQVQLVYVDKIETVDVKEDLSYVGKDVKEMTYEELQDLATAFDLRRVPLHKAMSLREMRAIAYVEYASKVMGRNDLDLNDEAFNYGDLPELIVGGGKRRDATKKVSNEEIIDAEQQSASTEGPQTTLTLEDLEQLARDKKINVPPSVRGDDEKKRAARHKWLYKELYGSAA